MAYTMVIKRKAYSAETLAAASRIYCTIRDRSVAGASSFAGVLLHKDGKPVGRISYNGRVWASLEYTPNETPLYAPN